MLAWPTDQKPRQFFYASSSVGNFAVPDGRRFVNTFCKAVGCGEPRAVDDSADDEPRDWAPISGAVLRRGPQVVFPSIDELGGICERAKEGARWRDDTGAVAIGGRVRLHSLASEAGAALTNRVGTVSAALADGRIAVRLDRGGEVKSVRLANLCQGPLILP